MIAPNIAALLQSLDTEQPSLTLEEVVEQVRQRTQTHSRSDILRQCSLVRSFNEDVFQLVCGRLPEKPSFEGFINAAAGRDRSSADIHSDGHGWWRVAEMPRAHYLREWQTTNEAKWREWNGRLADYFMLQPGPFAQVHSLYHLTVANPDRALELFPEWFEQADKTFDLAQCNALLEVLKTQENWRGPKLSAAWQSHRQHYLARSLFLQDYYKTAAYLERQGPLLAFRSVLDRTASDPWIFHIHATGGIGKTMFLRWLISRELIPAKIPCARVDFDDFKTVAEVVSAPLRLMVRIVEQLDQQLPHASLTSLLERLEREQNSPGWNVSVMAELQRQFKGARIETPLVIVLDTLEEPTLSHAQWLREIIGQLREFRGSIPKLSLILSGRYNVVERVPGLDAREYLHFELTPFTKDEAERFLRQRGISDGAVRTAITRKIGGEPFTGANPFMLALLTELALNRRALSPEEIAKLPRVDFAYLIERIILRVESQPLRWVIRYGAIARDLTPGFIQEVLLEPLKAALKGHQVADQPQQPSMEGMGRYQDVWAPDPQALAQVDAAVLWEELARFARDRGWISLVDGKAQVARFHPEVINPTRDLLRTQPVFADLQRRAIKHFENLAAKASTPQAWSAAVCEAIFHRFQLDSPDAGGYWARKLEEAFSRAPDAALCVAREVIGRDYAEGEMEPLAWGAPPRPIILRDTLVRAHCEVAVLLLERAGVVLFADTVHAKEFRRHMELAETISSKGSGATVPRFLRALSAALGESSPAGSLEMLEKLPPLEDREQFLLEIQLAEFCARLRRPEASDHYLRAVRLWDTAGVTAIQPHQLLVRLADWQQFIGDDTGMMDSLRRARDLREIPKEALVEILHREAAYALAVNDLATAEERVGDLWGALATREGNQSRQVLLLEAQLALQKDNLVGAARLCEQLLPGTGGQAAETARVYDVLGRAAIRRLDFAEGFDHFERSSKLYDDAMIVTGSARCAIMRMRAAAMRQGRLRDAESTLRHAFGLPGARDVEVYAELELLQAFIHWQSGRGHEARARVADLLQGKAKEWPARLAARLLFWTFAAGWQDRGPEFIARMLAAVSDMRPASARFSLLDILDHTTETTRLDPSRSQALLELFPRPRRDSAGFVGNTLGRAQLLYLIGNESGARAELELARTHLPREAPVEARFLQLWEINRAARQIGSPTGFGSMADSQAAGLLDSSALMGAVKLEAGIEAIQAGLLPRAELFLNWAGNRLSSESPHGIWHGRLDEARSALAAAQGKPQEAADRLESATRLYEQLGAVAEYDRVRRLLAPPPPAPPLTAEPPPPRAAAPAGLGTQVIMAEAPVIPAQPRHQRVILASTGFPSGMTGPRGLMELESAPRDLILDRLLGGWAEFAETLDRALLEAFPEASKTAQVTLEIQPGPLGALPWEIAPSLRQCEILNRASFQRSPPPFQSEIHAGQPNAVRLLLPRGNEGLRESNSYQGNAGVDLERLYYFASNTVPAVSYAPTPEGLHRELSERPCAVLHIVAAVREFSGGIYLDFESTEGRMSQRKGEDFSFFTPTYLDRVFASLKQPPFVILDIARSENDAETLRRFLLRNVYADQLLQLGHTCGILAAGLVDRFSQEFTAGPLLREIMNGAPLSRVARLVRTTQQPSSPYQPLVSELPSLGAALFADWPDVSPFAPPSRPT